MAFVVDPLLAFGKFDPLLAFAPLIVPLLVTNSESDPLLVFSLKNQSKTLWIKKEKKKTREKRRKEKRVPARPFLPQDEKGK